MNTRLAIVFELLLLEGFDRWITVVEFGCVVRYGSFELTHRKAPTVIFGRDISSRLEMKNSFLHSSSSLN